jgi:hypothetical protein
VNNQLCEEKTMSKKMLTFIAIFILLSACAPPVTDGPALPGDTAVPEEPEMSNAKPVSVKDEVVIGKAPVDEVEIVIQESFPVQVSAVVRGSLPDACTEINQASSERAGRLFTITATTVRSKDMACADVIKPFEEVVALDVLGLAGGVYTVNANGVTATFELQSDNESPAFDASQEAPTTGTDPGASDEAHMDKGEMIIGTAPVDSVQIELISPDPLRAQATVVGYLPDGCTELGEATQEWQGDVLVVTLTTKRPAGVACITMITPYKQAILLDTGGLSAGTYTVEVNGVAATLTVQ